MYIFYYVFGKCLIVCGILHNDNIRSPRKATYPTFLHNYPIYSDILVKVSTSLRLPRIYFLISRHCRHLSFLREPFPFFIHAGHHIGSFPSSPSRCLRSGPLQCSCPALVSYPRVSPRCWWAKKARAISLMWL